MYQINFISKTKFLDWSSVPTLSEKFKVFQSNLLSNFITVSLSEFITVNLLDLDKENGTQDGCLRMMHKVISLGVPVHIQYSHVNGLQLSF